jgi:MoxR-like ATPase
MKIKVDYPHPDAESAMLDAVDRGEPPDRQIQRLIKPVIDRPQLLAIRDSLALVRVEAGVREYVLAVVWATRKDDAVLFGAGPRSVIHLFVAAKARALMNGRDYVTPDDVVAMVPPVLAHRIGLTADAEISGISSDDVLQSILDRIEVPR